MINKPADAFELKGPKHDEVYLHSSANLYEDVIKEFNRLNVLEGIESKIATLFLHDNTNAFKELILNKEGAVIQETISLIRK